MSLATNLQNLATRIATEVKAIRTLVNGNQANLSGLTTTNKTTLVAAINEVSAAAAAAAAGATINDATTSASQVWSSTKTNSEIGSQVTAATAALVAAAPGALNTLDELAAALGDDPNFATATATALGNRVRFDAAQSLSAGQQLQACTNIAVGDPTTNFVTTFEAGLV